MKISTKLLVFGAIALLLISFTCNFVSASNTQFNTQPGQGNGQGGPGQGGHGGDVGDQRRQYERRNVDVGQYKNRAVITSSWEGDKSGDNLQMEFNFNEEYPKITLDYDAEKKGEEVQFSFTLEFREVFEFVDKNDNGRYDGNDEIIDSQDLSQKQFKNLNFEDEENGYRFNTESTDSSLGFDVRGKGEFLEHENQILTPSEAKIDLEFNHDFEREDSMLGLKIVIQSQHQKQIQERTYDEEKGYASNETGLRLLKNNYSGFFTWANTAMIDGELEDVNATFISETAVVGSDEGKTEEGVLYLSYKQGSEIVHDPKVGVVGESAISFTEVEEEPIFFFLTILGLTIAISGAVFYSGIYLRRKQR